MIRPGFYLGRAYMNRMFLLNFTLYNAEVAEREAAAFAAGGRVAEDCWPRRAGAQDRRAMITPVAADLGERTVRARELLAARACAGRTLRLPPGLQSACSASPSPELVQWVDELAPPQRGLRARRGTALPDEEASTDSIVETSPPTCGAALPAGRVRARRQHQDARHRARRVHRPRRSCRQQHAAGRLRRAATTYKAWVRFSGPGPGHAGGYRRRRLRQLRHQDDGRAGPETAGGREAHAGLLIASARPHSSRPTSSRTPSCRSHVLRGTPDPVFLTTGVQHFLDFIMQGLWNETQTSPLEARYWSCVPYLLGEGQAMMYSVRPASRKRSRIPDLPFRTVDRSTCASDGEHPRRTRMSNSISWSRCRPIRTACRSRTPACAGRRSCRPSFRWRRCACRRQRFDWAGAVRLRPQALLQPVALHRGAPAARQPEPCAPPHVLGAAPPAPDHERHAAHRADGDGTRCSGAARATRGYAFSYGSAVRSTGSAAPQSPAGRNRLRRAPSRTAAARAAGRARPLSLRARECIDRRTGQQRSCGCRAADRLRRAR